MIVRSGEKEFLAPLSKKNTKSGLLAIGRIKDKPEILPGQCTTDTSKKVHPKQGIFRCRRIESQLRLTRASRPRNMPAQWFQDPGRPLIVSA